MVSFRCSNCADRDPPPAVGAPAEVAVTKALLRVAAGKRASPQAGAAAAVSAAPDALQRLAAVHGFSALAQPSGKTRGPVRTGHPKAVASNASRRAVA